MAGGCLTTSAKRSGPGDPIPLYVVSNGVHIDLAFPVDAGGDWREFLPVDAFAHPLAGSVSKWISFGQGERNFYINTPTWSDLKFSTAVRAMFWPTKTAMHVKFLYAGPIESDSVRRVMVGTDQFKAFTEYLRASFEVNAKGRVIPIEGHHFTDRNDAFFEGTHTYHMLNTCNNWTGGALKRAGVPTPIWSPMAKPILWTLPAPEEAPPTSRQDDMTAAERRAGLEIDQENRRLGP